MRFLKAFFLIVGALAAGTARADAIPHPIFTTNMVLQQGTEVVVWGIATPGEEVTVGIGRDQGLLGSWMVSQAARADADGKWVFKFQAQKAGTGYTLNVKGEKNTIVLQNVAVGEVWLCSGQSNMEMPIYMSEDPEKVKAGAKNPDLRLFTVKRRAEVAPITDQKDLRHFTEWVVSSPEAIDGFSAVAYHFGQKLQKELGVPVGLINVSWGGTSAQAWTSLEALDAEPALKHYADAARSAAKKFEEDKKTYDMKKALEEYEVILAKWREDQAKAKAAGKAQNSGAPPAPGPTPPVNQGTPASLYNAMIHPLLNFKVRGAIWYQGESNNRIAYEYRTLFPTMIQDWRKRFAHDLPFMLVQLAPFGNENSNGVTYPELRDAQLYTSKKLPKVGLAVITDVGHETNIHPTPKGPVGERLALAALAIAYDKKIVYSGPIFKEAKFDGPTATLSFDHIGGGLIAQNGELTGFTIAGPDNVFVPATATIKGDTVVVTSDKVQKATAVRYGWVNFAKPTLNLFNKEGLPASPFRTDDAPYTTMPKPK